MARLRRDTQDTQFGSSPPQRVLRIVASGTLFLTHTLSLPSHPAPSTVVRAQSVVKTRGGSASTLLSLLAQFPSVDALLVAPLGGNDEGTAIIHDLEKEGVITRYCKVWEGAGVPSAWVLHSADTDARTVVNHNPLPDISHEEFVSLLGPLLVPENYLHTSPTSSPTLMTHAAAQPTPSPGHPRASSSSSGSRPYPFLFNPNSPAPFDWLHFEGRSVKTTLNNIIGLDGLARERKWRSHCVFSVDVGRKGRQGVEALIPHADILFVNKHYAQANSAHYATTPRAFLLSLTSIAPPHALLVAHWGKEGAAVLSLPTKEYFQSSGWAEDRSAAAQPRAASRPRGRANQRQGGGGGASEIQSVRSGSDFWAGDHSQTSSASWFTAADDSSDARSGTLLSPLMSRERSNQRGQSRGRGGYNAEDEDDADSQGTEVPGGRDEDDGVVDEVGAQDAFVAGMIYALSRRIAPGSPYTPSAGGEDTNAKSPESERGRWRLDECLRFATELSGRKARRRNWQGLAAEMMRAGWFDN